MVSQNTACNQFVDARFAHPRFLADENTECKVFNEPECLKFRDAIVQKYPDLALAIKADYDRIAAKYSVPSAHLKLLQTDQQLQVHDFNRLSDLGETSEFAQKQADLCGRITAKYSNDPKQAYILCSEVTGQYNITAPDVEHTQDLEPTLNRLSCHKWWKRELSKQQRVAIETVARDLQLVHAHKASYCSSITSQRFKQQKQNNRNFLESQIATNELSQEYSLADLSDLSVSNPSIRRIELITRCKGFEAVADSFGHTGVFITLTTPSRFHRMTKIVNSGKLVKVIPNKKFDNSSPRDAQAYLVSLWAKIQAKLSRESIKPYGFRVAEPHHDGTPHWHFLLFVKPEQKQQLIEIFTSWSLLDSPDEKGAQKNRIKIEAIKKGINPQTGKPYSATGYIIKYICKSIDGYGVDNTQSKDTKDWSNQDAIQSAQNIEAWARTFRIRQFQQIGGPSVTVWRELRRLEEQEGTLESIRKAAADGDWATFVHEMGGPNVKRNEQAVRPAYAPSQKLDTSTGEINTVTHTRYGDEAKDRVVGILITSITVLSRVHLWTIKENETLINARQKIMDGMVDILQEIQNQNTNNELAVNTDLLQSAKPAALDLFQ
ncbi:MAG: replication endonuclease [Colwellia sp.]